MIRGRSGRRDFSPSLEALQNRNQTQLLEILGAATPIIEEIAKVKPETWRSMTGLFSGLEKTFGGALRPARMIQNRFMNMFQGALAPVQVQLNNISNQVESFALQNQTGAIIGAAAGFVAGFVLPGGPLLWGTLFGGLGAAYESLSRDATFRPGTLIPQYGTPGPGDPLGIHGGGTTPTQYGVGDVLNLRPTPPPKVFGRFMQLETLHERSIV
jgi:hypothetical protein